MQGLRRRASIIVTAVKATCRSRRWADPEAAEEGVAAVSLANHDRGLGNDSCCSCRCCCCWCLCLGHRLQPGAGIIDGRMRSPRADFGQLLYGPLQNWFTVDVGWNQPHRTPRHERTAVVVMIARPTTHEQVVQTPNQARANPVLPRSTK